MPKPKPRKAIMTTHSQEVVARPAPTQATAQMQVMTAMPTTLPIALNTRLNAMAPRSAVAKMHVSPKDCAVVFQSNFHSALGSKQDKLYGIRRDRQ